MHIFVTSKVGTIILALELVDNFLFWFVMCFVTSDHLLTEKVKILDFF